MNDNDAQTWITLALAARGDHPESVRARLAMHALLDARAAEREAA